MDFWTVFYNESLQAPWSIKPEQGACGVEKKVATEFAFIVEEGLPDRAFEMLSKMVVAIKKSPEVLNIVEVQSHDVDQLVMVGEPKKILFFGTSYPGNFGQVRNWYGHQVIRTHSINDLLANSNLKAETWQHLKQYASLK